MKFIPVNEPLLDGNEKKYLTECIDTGWISSEGPFVKEFEQKISNRFNRKFGVAVTNGTAAIDTAIAALGICQGDEVILPSFTIISCVIQIVRSGAKPVLVDCDPVTWNMDVASVEEKINSCTKAIMAVHIYGLPVNMDPLVDLCSKYDIYLIEDAAEAIGLNYRGRPCGSFGDISTFSFYPNKHITTGEGGMVLTNNQSLDEACRSLRNLCFQPRQRFVHEDFGWNLRMTNLQAAIGLAQLERLDEFVEKKKKIGQLYNEILSDLPGVQLPCASTDYAENIYWVFGVVLDEAYGNAVEIMSKLAKEGIGTRPFFFPMNKQPVLLREGLFSGEIYPVAERLSSQGFYLPSGLSLSESDVTRCAETFRKILQ